MPSSSQKTEKATPKRRREAREKGQVLNSRDLTGAAVFMGTIVLARAVVPRMILAMQAMFGTVSAYSSQHEMGSAEAFRIMADLTQSAAILCLPILGGAVAISATVHLLQTGFAFTPKALNFKLGNLNPMAGLKRMFSLRSVAELIKGFLKMGVVGLVGFFHFRNSTVEMVNLSQLNVTGALSYAGNSTGSLLLKAGMGLIGLAVIDYFYQWWEYERKMKMSRQEVKDELKQQEGDPLLRSVVRQKQRQMSMRRMVQMVQKADVVIKNPTHYAVALQYEEAKRSAPVVVAKGQDRIALKIIEEAEKYHVQVVEDKPLAQSLYKLTDVGEEIPYDLYQAVAEVLAYVYRMRREGR